MAGTSPTPIPPGDELLVTFRFQFYLLADQMEPGGKSALDRFQLAGEASRAPLPLVRRPLHAQLPQCSQPGRLQLPGRGTLRLCCSDSAHRLLAPEMVPRATSFPAVCPAWVGCGKARLALQGGAGHSIVPWFFKPEQSQRGTGFPCLITACQCHSNAGRARNCETKAETEM